MHIAHVVTHLRLGAGRAIVDLAVEQARRGCRVQVAVSDDAEGGWRSDLALLQELRTAGVAVRVVGDVFHRDLVTLAPAVDALARLVPDDTGQVVAHAHTAMTAAAARWAGWPTVVTTCHGWNPTRRGDYDLQDALAYTLADAVLSPSTAWAEAVQRLPGRPHVHVVPYGLDVNRYPVRARSWQGRRVVCVGELSDRKGQDVLLRAWPAVGRAVPDASLHFIGSGEAEGRLRTLAGSLPEGARVHFRGHVEAPHEGFLGGDLLCLPSRSDNQPLAIIEAMLAGVPVVASAVGGIAEMLVGAPGCATVPPDDEGALATTLVQEMSRPWGASTGETLAVLARRRYAVATCADQVEAIYAAAVT